MPVSFDCFNRLFTNALSEFFKGSIWPKYQRPFKLPANDVDERSWWLDLPPLATLTRGIHGRELGLEPC